MKPNVEKSKVMGTTRIINLQININSYGSLKEIVEKYKYLGTRIEQARLVFLKMRNPLVNQSIRDTKIQYHE